MLFACALMGVIASTNPLESLAAFTCGSDTVFAHVGEDVQGWEVKEVAYRYVTVKKGAEAHQLFVGSDVDTITAMDFKKLGGSELRGGTLYVTEALKDYVANEGLITTLMQTCSEPVVIAGQTVGYRLFEIDKGSAFELAGIKENDVITEIDGDRLTNPVVALGALSRLRKLKKFSFRFVRDGREDSRTVEVR